MASDDQKTGEVIFVGIGEFCVSDKVLSSIGLGSCVGLVLHDTDRMIGGLAHVMLPESHGQADRPGKFANTAVGAMLDEIYRKRPRNGRLIAKLVGGASMFARFSENFSIGDKNIEAVRAKLKECSIPIVAEDVGGTVGRTMHYYPYEKGKIVIRRGDGSRVEI